MLRSPYAGSRSQGILLLSSDGSRGLIMVAGMGPLSPSIDYHVWLMRGRDKVRVGRRQEPKYLRPAKGHGFRRQSCIDDHTKNGYLRCAAVTDLTALTHQT